MSSKPRPHQIHVLIVPHGLENLGEMARLYGVIESLLQSTPSGRITISCRYERDRDNMRRHILERRLSNIEVKRHPWLIETHWLLPTAILSGMVMLSQLFLAAIRYVFSLVSSNVRRVHHQYDLVIDLNLADLSDANVGCIMGSILALASLSYHVLSGKPVVACSASIRGFNRFFWSTALRTWCRSVCNRLQLVIARDRITYAALRNLGITKPQMEMCPDFAFLGFWAAGDSVRIRSYQNKRSRGSKSLIAIIPRWEEVNAGHRKMHSERPQLVAKLGDFCVEHFNTRIVFMPFSFAAFYNDVGLCHAAREQMRHKEKASVVVTSQIGDVNDIMRQCMFCLSFRLHGGVAATCWAVPSVIIATFTSPKFAEVISYATGQKVFLADISKESDQEAQLNIIRTQVLDAWEHKEGTKKALLRRVGEIKLEILSVSKHMIACVTEHQS